MKDLIRFGKLLGKEKENSWFKKNKKKNNWKEIFRESKINQVTTVKKNKLKKVKKNKKPNLKSKHSHIIIMQNNWMMKWI